MSKWQRTAWKEERGQREVGRGCGERERTAGAYRRPGRTGVKEEWGRKEKRRERVEGRGRD